MQKLITEDSFPILPDTEHYLLQMWLNVVYHASPKTFYTLRFYILLIFIRHSRSKSPALNRPNLRHKHCIYYMPFVWHFCLFEKKNIKCLYLVYFVCYYILKLVKINISLPNFFPNMSEVVSFCHLFLIIKIYLFYWFHATYRESDNPIYTYIHINRKEFISKLTEIHAIRRLSTEYGEANELAEANVSSKVMLVNVY